MLKNAVGIFLFFFYSDDISSYTSFQDWVDFLVLPRLDI